MDIKELSKLVNLDLKEQLDDAVKVITSHYDNNSSIVTEEIKKTLKVQLEKQRDLYFKQLKEYYESTQKQLDEICDSLNKRLDETLSITKETNQIMKLSILKNKGVMALHELTSQAKKILKFKKIS